MAVSNPPHFLNHTTAASGTLPIATATPAAAITSASASQRTAPNPQALRRTRLEGLVRRVMGTLTVQRSDPRDYDIPLEELGGVFDTVVLVQDLITGLQRKQIESMVRVIARNSLRCTQLQKALTETDNILKTVRERTVEMFSYQGEQIEKLETQVNQLQADQKKSPEHATATAAQTTISNMADRIAKMEKTMEEMKRKTDEYDLKFSTQNAASPAVSPSVIGVVPSSSSSSDSDGASQPDPFQFLVGDTTAVDSQTTLPPTDVPLSPIMVDLSPLPLACGQTQN